MSEEINNITTILHSLQNKVDRLETVNKELEEKLLQQNETIGRLVTKRNNISLANQDQEQVSLLEKDDLEKSSFNHQLQVDKEDTDKITIEKSIHSLPLVNILGR
jgi:predicted RNase H-like nuclease (RuvC/YqgF family)